MPLPPGFKVHGSPTAATTAHIPPLVKRMITMLDALPTNELLTTREAGARLTMTLSGSTWQHPALDDYREKVDNRLFWGSKKSIAKLRQQLAEPEETQNENQ